jgi:hypothetical protein
MPKDLHKHTLHLHTGDYEALAELYPEVPVAGVIRTLIRNHLEEKRADIPTVKVEGKL